MSTTLGSSLILPSTMQWKRSSLVLAPQWHCSHLDLGPEEVPTDALNVSDGSIKPLSPQEEKELRDHINSGHVKKSNLCKGCLLSEGPRKLHKIVRDVDRATHVLHIDIAGPYIESHEGHHYFLVGALRLPRCKTAQDKNISRSLCSIGEDDLLL